jgi:hypothetical protein
MTITGHIHPPLIDHARNPVGVLSAVLGGVGLAALAWAWLLTTSIDPGSGPRSGWHSGC